MVDIAPAWDIEGATLEELRDLSETLRAIQLKQARGLKVPDGLPTGAGPFAEYVLRHEKTDEPIQNGDHHQAWHDFLDRSQYGCILAPVGHGKTQQIAIARVLYALGKDPNLRIGIVCATDRQAQERVGQILQHLQLNGRVQEVFPDLQLDPKTKLTEHQFTVERTTNAKDPSVQAFSVGSSAITGARLDILLLDDVLDQKNVNTVDLRMKMVDWFDTKAYTRLPIEGTGRIWCIGTPWHHEDLLHVLMDRPDWGSQVWSAVMNPDDPVEVWESLWPEVMPPSELVKRQANMTPHAFARKYLCRVRDEAASRFQQVWINSCLKLGAGRSFLDQSPTDGWMGAELPCFTGVDLGVGQEEHHDLTALVTIALMRDRKRLLIDIRSGRWSAPEIIRQVVRVQRRYRSIVVVESNAAQDFMTQFIGEADVPVVAFNTGSNKHDEDFGIETLAVELRAKRWILPAGPAGQAVELELKALLREMRNYQPGDHTGDRLMAMWFAREHARLFQPPSDLPDGALDATYR
jgi:hypothetical protein